MDQVFDRTRKIPSKSWGLECSLCSSRHGVPIECSARGCKAAYHTTCAIRGKLKMQAIFGKNFKGGIKLRSYCKNHSPSIIMQDGELVQSDKIDDSGVREIDMTNMADDRLQEGSEELDHFWKYVDLNEVHKNISHMYARSKKLELAVNSKDLEGSDHEITPKKNKKNKAEASPSQEAKKSPKKTRIKEDADGKLARGAQEVDPLIVDIIYRYWMMLRTANNGQSLIKFSPSALKEREFEQRKSIIKLRVELERVRNLSYMIGKREKLKAAWLKTHQNIIQRTFSVINDLSPVSDANEVSLVSDLSSTNHHDQKPAAHQPHSVTLPANGKKSLHQTQHHHIQPSNGMFDESDQLINDLITCDRIYDLPPASSSVSNNHSNLSFQERSTLERRRTLSLVRRINRQLKSLSATLPPMNPYAKSYIAPKRNDSPNGQQLATASNKVYKYK